MSGLLLQEFAKEAQAVPYRIWCEQVLSLCLAIFIDQ